MRVDRYSQSPVRTIKTNKGRANSFLRTTPRVSGNREDERKESKGSSDTISWLDANYLSDLMLAMTTPLCRTHLPSVRISIYLQVFQGIHHFNSSRHNSLLAIHSHSFLSFHGIMFILKMPGEIANFSGKSSPQTSLLVPLIDLTRVGHHTTIILQA